MPAARGIGKGAAALLVEQPDAHRVAVVAGRQHIRRASRRRIRTGVAEIDLIVGVVVAQTRDAGLRLEPDVNAVRAERPNVAVQLRLVLVSNAHVVAFVGRQRRVVQFSR